MCLRSHIPHPFDSHPPMSERMKNVAYEVRETDYAAIVMCTPAATWADEIATASGIEQRLWSVYEENFAQNHELSLAYRYEPANEQEREHVLKYFPAVVFELKNGATVEVNYSGIVASTGEGSVQWDDIKAMAYNDSSFGDTLAITLNEKGMIGPKTTKLKLGGLKDQKETFQATVSNYWQRHQVMRQQQAG